MLGITKGLSNPGLWLGLSVGASLLSIFYSQLAWTHDWDISADECSRIIDSYIEMSRREDFANTSKNLKWGI